MFFITIMGAYESYSKEYDCYIELKCNKEIRRTTIDYYKKKPQWNEMFLFKNKSDKIELTVYDSNRFFPNTVISYSKHKLTFKNKYNYSIVQNIEIKYGIINDTTIENNILKKEYPDVKYIVNKQNITSLSPRTSYGNKLHIEIYKNKKLRQFHPSKQI